MKRDGIDNIGSSAAEIVEGGDLTVANNSKNNNTNNINKYKEIYV